ncbi:MAG TPA: DUF357 domain-containing protein [archaeon]|nr:DUF357 domain-containing protein [archaeon]
MGIDKTSIEKQSFDAESVCSSLKDEIEKWTERAKEKRKTIDPKNTKNAGLVKNIDAYIKDSKYFLEKNDLVRSFEAIIWAWSWLEILEELEIIKS